MDNATAQAVLSDLNDKMTILAEAMRDLRNQQLQVLKAAQTIASEDDVKTAIATIGLISQGSRFLRVPEGATVISSLTLGKYHHKKEIALPLIDGSADWIASRPSGEPWYIGSAPLINAAELFNERKRTTFLGL